LLNKNSFSGPLALAGFGLLVGAEAAIAQEPSEDSVRVLGAITVNVTRPGLTQGGSSAVEVDLDSLDHAPAPTMEDVVRALPLIDVRTNSRGEAQPALRGSQDRQITILMDGVPLTLGWDHRADMSIIPLTAARRVTLIRGLSSVLYGPNTLGGVIAVDVARTDQQVPSIDPLTLGLALDHTGGANVSARGGGTFRGAWVVRGGGGFEDRPGRPIAGGLTSDVTLRTAFLADGDRRLNDDLRRVDGFFLASYRRPEGPWASISTSGSDVQRGVPAEAHLDEPRFWRYPDQRRLVAAVAGGTGTRTTRAGEGSLELNLGIDLGSSSIEQFDTELYDVVSETEEADDLVLSVRLVAEHTLSSRGEAGVALTFADVLHDEVLGPGPTSSYRQQLWSAGAETSWRVGGSRRTTITVGAVVDGADTPETGPQPPRGRIWDYGLRVGASSLVGRGLQVHAAASRRARFPSLRELYSGALGRFEPNPQLGAERLLGVEAGITALWGLSELQLVGFRHALDGGIGRTTVIGSDGLPRFQRINHSELRSSGLELLAVGEVGATTLTGDLTLQRVRGLDDAGLLVPVEYEPSVRGKAGLEIPLPNGIQGSATVRFESQQSCENHEIGRAQTLPASTSLDVTARRRFDLSAGPLGRFEVSASVRNATDAAVFYQCGLPQSGRLLRLQLRVW
jgi:iron complex outermembrane receptor protein